MMRIKALQSAALVAALLAPSQPGLAHSVVARGPARTATDAPGGAGLAPLPVEHVVAQMAPAELGRGHTGAPASERAMSFGGANAGECRESVPGGTMLAIAYAVAIVLMGAYVAFIAWKNVQLARAIDALEAQLAKKTGASDRS